MEAKFSANSRIFNTINKVKGVVVAQNLTTPFESYDVEYDKIGLRLRQPATTLELNTSKPRPGSRPRKKYNREDENFVNFIDFLKVHGTIRVQAPQSAVPGFCKRYRETTGEVVDFPSSHASVIVETAKWGCSVTVLFPPSGADLVPNDISAGPYTKGSSDWAVYGNDFAYELFELGFRLGRATETFCTPGQG